MNTKKFGKKLKRLRLENNMTLREITKKVDYDSSNWSKIERGLLSPPSNEEKLSKWAEALNLSDSEARKFIDEALAVQGKIPEDIVEKEAELIPAFFRTMRKEGKPTEEDFEKLKEKLKEERNK